MKYLLIIPMSMLALLLILSSLNKYLPVWFCLNFGHWHLPPKQFGFDGCSSFGICPRCEKRVMQDGQGNWF
jgi:hypothetical protein